SAVVDEVIPPPHDELSLAVLEAVARSDPAGALFALDGALQTGRTVDRFCDHLIDHVRTLMLIHVCGADTDLVDVGDAMRSTLVEQAGKFDAPTYVYMIALLEEVRRSVRSSGAARALADAAVVRLAMSRQFSDIAPLLERLESASTSAVESPPSSRSVAPPLLTDAKKNDTIEPVAVKPPTRSSIGNPKQWERAINDPLVRKVKDAVEGTLLDVRPAGPESPRAASPASAEEAEEDSSLFAAG
ncbi:MAG: hypothetical protein Q7R41_03810, partial [Phycisphaerales bacterium]|nr:hypothetical protein [Phycisphaerales bacterium]